ncbi:[FeFe] hydrogenase H-cluster radical SAM maturase HydE [Pseudobacteroides cellulosolvens]|nr:[FeFe] hydrogenase H-cluster radical SAM maturase HydE [Pseudobacteroides cellulosolvens]
MKDILKLDMLVNTLENEHELDKNSLAELLECKDVPILYTAADRVRKKFVGDDVYLRGLIEFSNFCCRTCFYCGLRAANSGIKRYRMEPGEVIECAANAVKYGLKTIVLQSGEDKFFTVNDLCKIVDKIKDMGTAVTLSVGELSRNDYTALKHAGADRYLLRIETSNEKLYESLHPRMSYKNRVRCLYDLKELGYETGTGCLIGLPGQTPEMLAEDLLFFKKIDADMIGMGPFIPCKGTPLEYEAEGNVETVLKMMALARLLMPDINMPVTTALGVKADDGYRKGLGCGANVIMPNMGIDDYKKLYAIYPGKGDKVETLENQINVIKCLISKEGRVVGKHFGGRIRTVKI